MQIDYTLIVVVAVCAITFYRVGRYERSWGLLWAALSLCLSVLAVGVLKLGLIGVFAGQATLFVGITVYRMRSGE